VSDEKEIVHIYAPIAARIAERARRIRVASLRMVHAAGMGHPGGDLSCAEVPELQKLMRFCRHGFEHHAAMNASHSAAVLVEAMENYLSWEVYVHGAGSMILPPEGASHIRSR
jgi:hypothetical protein